MDVVSVVSACKAKAKERGLSLLDVARLVGVSKSQVGHWWNDRRVPSAQNLLSLISAVGLRFELVDDVRQVAPVADARIEERVAQPLPVAIAKTTKKTTAKTPKSPVKARKGHALSHVPAGVTDAAKSLGLDPSGLTIEVLEAALQDRAGDVDAQAVEELRRWVSW